MREIRIYNRHNPNPASQLLPSAMIVCVCRRVSDREIARHVRAGMNFDEVQFELGVATQCGQCEGCARDIVAQCSASHPVAALNRESGASAIQLATSISESKAWNSSRHSAAA
jgi:bacterioferritin-associated ferredoxin